MTIAEIIELVGLIITGVGLVFSIYKWFMANKWSSVKKFIEEKMIEAEEKGMGGAEKLNYVMKAVYDKYGTFFVKKEKEIEDYIEDCIDFSKKINHK